MKKALILVDIQNDFLPGGALAVPEGDQILPIVNALQQEFELIIATQDFHPANHGSFATNHDGHKLYEVVDLNGLDQVLWPVHCVQGSPGADLAPGLEQEGIQKVFPKGTDNEIDSYSGFFDNGRRKATGLGSYLQDLEVDEVYVVGLATDYCVKYTALDAVSLGFKTFVIQDATRGVNVQAGDVENAFQEMTEGGVQLVYSHQVLTEKLTSSKH